jgi:hypothetical protein
MHLLPGFGASSPPPPVAPPPVPMPNDPAIAAAKNKQRLAELQRMGRASTNLTGNSALGDAPVDRPGATAARSATLLGD